ncbi:hypothetical protein D6D01_03441 [Aureobasidium pullulans]|uniref:BTB domain-containing protein n=1 Tax=Aureobasidium pullulans TaxID=5580 RepID=A0A4V4JWL1_AURPU|nr:hypothetical protein D6D01_03441 [Aureobasidium pullulans]
MSTPKLYKDTVTVAVGTAEDNFVVHKDLLCFYSDFFRAAFNGSFEEATERKIKLPDVCIQTFESFQVWLYSRTLLNTEDSANESGHATYLTFTALAKLWIFGDKYLIPLLQNNVIDAMHDKNEKETNNPVLVIKMAYTKTLPGSCLRRAVIDILVHKAQIDGQPGSMIAPPYLNWWTTEALADALTVMASSWKSGLPRFTTLKNERCHYHVHTEGEHC